MSTTVMIVDASVEVRQEAQAALSKAGFLVIEAADGVEGIERLVAIQNVALVICDLGVDPSRPASGGSATAVDWSFQSSAVDFIDALGTLMGDRAPPIVLSTYDPEVSRLARALGACGCIVKPLDASRLVAIVRRLTLSVAA